MLKFVILSGNAISGLVNRKWLTGVSVYQLDLSRNNLEGFDFEGDGLGIIRDTDPVPSQQVQLYLSHNSRFRHLPARMPGIQFGTVLMANTSASVFTTPWTLENQTWAEISAVQMDLRFCPVGVLPGIDQPAKLERLNVEGASTIPGPLDDGICNLRNLKLLDLTDTAVTALPVCLRELPSLAALILDGSAVRRLPRKWLDPIEKRIEVLNNTYTLNGSLVEVYRNETRRSVPFPSLTWLSARRTTLTMDAFMLASRLPAIETLDFRESFVTGSVPDTFGMSPWRLPSDFGPDLVSQLYQGQGVWPTRSEIATQMPDALSVYEGERGLQSSMVVQRPSNKPRVVLLGNTRVASDGTIEGHPTRTWRAGVIDELRKHGATESDLDELERLPASQIRFLQPENGSVVPQALMRHIRVGFFDILPPDVANERYGTNSEPYIRFDLSFTGMDLENTWTHGRLGLYPDNELYAGSPTVQSLLRQGVFYTTRSGGNRQDKKSIVTKINVDGTSLVPPTRLYDQSLGDSAPNSVWNLFVYTTSSSMFHPLQLPGLSATSKLTLSQSGQEAGLVLLKAREPVSATSTPHTLARPLALFPPVASALQSSLITVFGRDLSRGMLCDWSLLPQSSPAATWRGDDVSVFDMTRMSVLKRVYVETLLRINSTQYEKDNAMSYYWQSLGQLLPGVAWNRTVEPTIDPSHSIDMNRLPKSMTPLYTGMPTYRTESQFVSKFKVLCPTPQSPALRGSVVLRLRDANPVNANGEAIVQALTVPSRPMPPVLFEPGCPAGSSVVRGFDTDMESEIIWRSLGEDALAGQFNSILSESGATYCSLCAPGGYSNRSGSEQCLSCPPGTISTAEGSTFCTACPERTYQPDQGQSQCRLCLPGTFGPTEGLQQCLDCPAGTFSTNEEIDSTAGSEGCTPCPLGSFSPTNRSAQCASCPIGTFTSSTGSTVCSTCPSNSRSLIKEATKLTDCFCEEGYYGPAGGPCTICPAGALCRGMTTDGPRALPGYYAYDQDPLTFLRCLPEEACLGWTDESNSTCAEGYEGPLCGRCTPLLYYRLAERCTPCGRGAEYLWIGFLLAALTGCAAVLWMSRPGDMKLFAPAIALSYVQLLSLFHNFSVPWPSLALSFFDAASISNLNVDLFSVECSVQLSFFDRWFMKQAMPFGLATIMTLYFFALPCILSCTRTCTAMRHALHRDYQCLLGCCVGFFCFCTACPASMRCGVPHANHHGARPGAIGNIHQLNGAGITEDRVLSGNLGGAFTQIRAAGLDQKAESNRIRTAISGGMLVLRDLQNRQRGCMQRVLVRGLSFTSTIANAATCPLRYMYRLALTAGYFEGEDVRADTAVPNGEHDELLDQSHITGLETIASHIVRHSPTAVQAKQVVLDLSKAQNGANSGADELACRVSLESAATAASILAVGLRPRLFESAHGRHFMLVNGVGTGDRVSSERSSSAVDKLGEYADGLDREACLGGCCSRQFWSLASAGTFTWFALGCESCGRWACWNTVALPWRATVYCTGLLLRNFCPMAADYCGCGTKQVKMLQEAKVMRSIGISSGSPFGYTARSGSDEVARYSGLDDSRDMHVLGSSKALQAMDRLQAGNDIIFETSSEELGRTLESSGPNTLVRDKSAMAMLSPPDSKEAVSSLHRKDEQCEVLSPAKSLDAALVQLQSGSMGTMDEDRLAPSIRRTGDIQWTRNASKLRASASKQTEQAPLKPLQPDLQHMNPLLNCGPAGSSRVPESLRSDSSICTALDSMPKHFASYAARGPLLNSKAVTRSKQTHKTNRGSYMASETANTHARVGPPAVRGPTSIGLSHRDLLRHRAGSSLYTSSVALDNNALGKPEQCPLGATFPQETRGESKQAIRTFDSAHPVSLVPSVTGSLSTAGQVMGGVSPQMRNVGTNVSSNDISMSREVAAGSDGVRNVRITSVRPTLRSWLRSVQRPTGTATEADILDKSSGFFERAATHRQQELASHSIRQGLVAARDGVHRQEHGHDLGPSPRSTGPPGSSVKHVEDRWGRDSPASVPPGILLWAREQQEKMQDREAYVVGRAAALEAVEAQIRAPSMCSSGMVQANVVKAANIAVQCPLNVDPASALPSQLQSPLMQVAARAAHGAVHQLRQRELTVDLSGLSVLGVSYAQRMGLIEGIRAAREAVSSLAVGQPKDSSAIAATIRASASAAINAMSAADRLIQGSSKTSIGTVGQRTAGMSQSGKGLKGAGYVARKSGWAGEDSDNEKPPDSLMAATAAEVELQHSNGDLMRLPAFKLALLPSSDGEIKELRSLRIEPSVTDRFLYAATTIASVAYTFLASTSLEPMNCIPQPDGSLVLKVAPDVKCFEGQHASMLPYVAVAVVFWVIGTPIAVSYVLLRARANGTLGTPLFDMKHGTLTLPYRPEVWWFELVSMMRKLAVVLAVQFLGRDGTPEGVIAQLVVAMSIFVFFLLVLLFYQPYVLQTNNRLAIVTTIALLFTIFSAVLFLSDKLTEVGSYYTAFSMILINTIACATVFTTVGQEIQTARHRLAACSALGLNRYQLRAMERRMIRFMLPRSGPTIVQQFQQWGSLDQDMFFADLVALRQVIPGVGASPWSGVREAHRIGRDEVQIKEAIDLGRQVERGVRSSESGTPDDLAVLRSRRIEWVDGRMAVVDHSVNPLGVASNFPCTVCAKEFARQSNLTRHMASKHPAMVGAPVVVTTVLSKGLPGKSRAVDDTQHEAHLH